MTSLSEGGSPQQEARVRMALHEVLEAGDWDAADHADFIINVAAGLVARGLLLSSPRAPESTPTEGFPDELLREVAQKLSEATWQFHTGPNYECYECAGCSATASADSDPTTERHDDPCDVEETLAKVRAYLSSREQPQDGT